MLKRHLKASVKDIGAIEKENTQKEQLIFLEKSHYKTVQPFGAFCNATTSARVRAFQVAIKQRTEKLENVYFMEVFGYEADNGRIKIQNKFIQSRT